MKLHNSKIFNSEIQFKYLNELFRVYNLILTFDEEDYYEIHEKLKSPMHSIRIISNFVDAFINFTTHIPVRRFSFDTKLSDGKVAKTNYPVIWNREKSEHATSPHRTRGHNRQSGTIIFQ